MITRTKDRYQTMDVTGMAGPRLVVFTYSHILCSLRLAERAIGHEDHEGRCAALCRARDLVYELLYSLDEDQGGEVARNLAGLYQHFIREITQIDLHPDQRRLEKLVEMVATLHEAWQAAAREVTEAAVPAAVNE